MLGNGSCLRGIGSQPPADSSSGVGYPLGIGVPTSAGVASNAARTGRRWCCAQCTVIMTPAL